MSIASERNFSLAQRARDKRIASSLMGEGTIGGPAPDPAWDAFFEALQEKQDQAAAAGMGFRADLGGLGRPGFSLAGGGRLTPTDVSGIAGNVALGRYTDETHAKQLAVQDALDARQQQALNDAHTGYLQQVGASLDAPPIDHGVLDVEPGAKADKYTMRPAAMDPREQFLSRLPPSQRAQIEAKLMPLENERAKLEETARHDRATEQAANPFAAAGATGAPQPGATGQAAIAHLPAPIQTLIKKLAGGEMPFPSSVALKMPYWQNIVEYVGQYDPSFDTALASNNARQKVRQDFTSGKSASQINALNTVIGHLGQFSDAADGLGNGSYEMVNGARNRLLPGGSGHGVALGNFNTLKNGVTAELTRVWRGTGGSEQDIKDWASTIGDTKSPAQLHGALNQIGGMLQSKLDSLNDQYKQGMGRDAVNLLAPESASALAKLQGRSAASTQSAAATPGAGDAVAMVAPDGRPLMVPAAKVAELEAHGAKRRQ